MSDTFQSFTIQKRTGTHADVFAAVGLADLLRSAQRSGPVQLINRDIGFEVRLAAPITRDALVKGIGQSPGYPFLKANDKVHVPSEVRDLVDYKAEKAKADRRRELANSKKRGKRKVLDTETQQLIQEEQLRGDWRLLQVLNTLQGDETANRVHETIVKQKEATFRQDLSSALEDLSQQKLSRLKWKVSTVQLFTPIAAKGYSRLKPDSTDRNDKTKEQWADPFTEWLRYRGYFRIACPFFQGQKAEHVRLICPIPHDISIGAIESVAREMRKGGVYGGAPKLDALAVLKLAELLVRHSEEYHDPGAEVFPGLSLSGKTPAAVISGVTVTHYQSLGNAKAVSAMSTLALPGWFPISSREDAEDWLGILGEHQRVIRGLQDDRSDEVGLLVAYRRFLETRGDDAVRTLVEFMERYGPFVMRANGTVLNGRVRWTTRFTDQYFRRIVMGTNASLVEILNDSGFEAVARALRQATVTSQNRKARGDQVWREIRYELLHDLHRTRKVPGTAFVECVTEFISRYNYENARRRETERNPKAAPANVSDAELTAFLALVDRHGASLVGSLLAAYGSCKEKWEPEEDEGAESSATAS
ncbi:MAG TPA: hypothetical protein VFS39_16895 [Nitrospira sp.]|nr:hypothetical protein [Nitrospira sp.]